MSELERDLDRLAPSVSTGPGLEHLRLRRRRRRWIGRASVLAVVVAAGVGGLVLAGREPRTDPFEVAGTAPEPSEQSCILRLVDRLAEGPVGVVLRNESDTACSLPAVTGAGRDGAGVSHRIAVVPMDDVPLRSTPTMLDPGETISVVAFNRPWLCPAPVDDRGLVDIEARIGDREIALAPDASLPQCGIAIAVVDGVVAATGSVEEPDDLSPTPCELEYSLRRAGEVDLGRILRVSFVNVADAACTLDAVEVVGTTSSGESVRVPAGAAGSEPTWSLPAVVEPGDGIALVLTQKLDESACAEGSTNDLITIEVAIGEKVVDVVPGLDSAPWSSCGLVFAVVAEDEPWFGVPGDPTESLGQICRLSYPAQCDDPFIRIG